ncbi:MAG: M20/M25/M40 family metallo-hydrolase [Chloroflexi bacterium]|nr:M20/M25/M40 family metallo-hydrolase [Chloroflexota bacterium]
MLSELEKKVLTRVEQMEPELTQLALELGGRISNQPEERIAGDYAFDWLKSNGFQPRKLGAAERFNILGVYRGTGGGRSLIFSSHLDVRRGEMIQLRIRDPNRRVFREAWREGDSVVGMGIANDKGPMACWMTATRALQDLNIKLPGDVLLSCVLGETGGSPVDEFPSPQYDSHELGARYLATHGGIADFALVAEATAFTICPVECGFAYIKLTLYSGPASYTPFLPYPETDLRKSINPINRMGKFIERFAMYANDYTARYRYSHGDVEVVPKISINSMRSGQPFCPITSPELCIAYIDARIPPGISALDIKRQLESLLKELDMEGDVEIYKYLSGYEAWKVKGYDEFRAVLLDSHTKVFGTPPKKPVTYMTSMWRDINTYNEIGIPAITYGFPTGYSAEGQLYDYDLFRVEVSDMVQATKVYALLALDVCSRMAA